MLTAPRSITIRLILALLFTLLVASCVGLANPLPTPTAVWQTVQVTREVTFEVTREVTREVQVPVTVTPTLTPLYTPTETFTPTLTPTPELPIVTVMQQSACRYGPGSAYLYFYDLYYPWRMEVVGRNQDASWLYIEGIHGWNPCWIKTTLVRVDSGNIYDSPITRSRLPRALFYAPPPYVDVYRIGEEVTVEWDAVWMTEDDYRGYLIEAEVCRDGQLVSVAINPWPPLEENEGKLEATIIDEYGCRLPSSGRIYTVEKHGYTPFKVIYWPAWRQTPTPAQTPTETFAPPYLLHP